MNNKFWFIPIGILALGLFSCAAKEAPSPAAPAPIGAVKSEVKSGWEAEWDKALEKGRKEGKVLVYTSSGNEVKTSLTEAFPKATGIAMDFLVTGRSGEALSKWTSERNAGLYLPDIWISGTTGSFTARSKGFLQPLQHTLILPEVKDPNMWFQKKLPFIDKNENTLFAFLANAGGHTVLINTDKVKSNEVISFYDLLNPKWKGKMVMDDPTTGTGTGQKVFRLGVLRWGLNLDYWKQMAQQELFITRDHRLQAEVVARGKYPIGIGLNYDVTIPFAQAGAPIKHISPKEEIYYVSVSGGVMSLADKAPHPNAAKVFINWLLTKEGQTVFSRALLDNSARIDVPTDHLESYKVRDPKAEYLQIDTEELQTSTKWFELLDTAKEIFGHLLR